MSGSGGGNGGGAFGGGGGSEPSNCQEISIKTNITSPDPEILSLLEVGDTLEVQLRTSTGPLVAITDSGDVLGAIFTRNPLLLINCINDGFTYVAKILSISGADCQVLITAT